MTLRPTPCVQFEGISKTYHVGWRRRPIRALVDVSLTVDTGDVLGLIGPNRAGKTTLVKILLSLCHPTSGRFWRLGADGRERRTLARVGYVHERQSFPDYLTAASLLQYYGSMALVPPAELKVRVPKLIEQVGLIDWRDMPIGHYSKGMVQRLALAQAMVNEPELLVLDEPTEGMDIEARRLMRQVVLDRRRLKQTTILISHALIEVEALCNKIAVLTGGRLCYVGAPNELVRPTSMECADPSPMWTIEAALEPYYAGSAP